MVGLGLAVAFSLLILDRLHREELPPGGEPRTAASAALLGLERTGRAVLVAGGAFVLALLLVSAVGPTELMNSVGTSALVWNMPCSAISSRYMLCGPSSWISREVAPTPFPVTGASRKAWNARRAPYLRPSTAESSSSSPRNQFSRSTTVFT